MADGANKTTATDGDVQAFIASVRDVRRQQDAVTLLKLMQDITGQAPLMWGNSIVGFGSRHYRYASGREGDTAAVAFSPRKAQAVLYLSGELAEYRDLLDRLGPHQTGKSCLYLKQVEHVDIGVLGEIVSRSYQAATPSLG